MERFRKDCAFKIEGDATVSSVIGLHGPEVSVREKAAAET